MKTARLLCKTMAVAMVAACGSRQSSTKTLTPKDGFAREEPANATGSVCSGSTCSKIRASGVILQGSFVFENLLTTCSLKENGIAMHFANSQQTVEATLSFRGFQPSNLQGLVACKGVEYESTDPQVKLKDKFCEVSFGVHGRFFVASAAQPCELVFDESDVTRAVLACVLEGESGKLTLEGGSVIQCPETSFR